MAGQSSGPKLKQDFHSLLCTPYHFITQEPHMHWLDNTKQSPSSLDTPSETHTSAVLVCTYFSWSTLSGAWLSWEGVWPVDLPGAADKQAGGLQWWLNHLLGASEG